MPRPSKTRRLDVWMNGELVGHWTITPPGQHEFRYAAAWLDTPGARPISLSMPLQPPDVPYRDARVESYFDNLLPDSAEIRRRVQSRFATASTSPFDLLAEIGRDCVGAIQLLPAGAQPGNVQRIDGDPLMDADVAGVLRSVVSAPPLGQREEDEFRISIAGSQEKTALLWHKKRWYRPQGATPTTHILKLPLGRVGNVQADLSMSVENEWLCAQIVRAYGLEVARSEMARFEEQRVLIVERFDRRLARDRNWWLRLPQEDMCQALAIPPGQKYESDGGPGIPNVMSLLLGARDAQGDRQAFFKAQILFWMLCAIDAHAKNFSVFIEPLGRFSLTPLYDILSAYPVLGHAKNQLAPEKVRMAMAVRGEKAHYQWSRVVRRHWVATAEACALGPASGRLIAELVDRTPAAIADVSSRLPGDFPHAVVEPIFQGLTDAAERLARGGEVA